MAQDTFARVVGISANDKTSQLDIRLEKIEANGMRYKGVVLYYDQLPTSDVKIGDMYTVKYVGTSTEAGTTVWGAEVVCAKIDESGTVSYEEVGLATQASIVGESLILGQAVGTVVGETLVF